MSDDDEGERWRDLEEDLEDFRGERERRGGVEESESDAAEERFDFDGMMV